MHPSLRLETETMFREMNEALSGRAMIRLAYTLRSYGEQNELYAQGRTKPGKIVTKAKGGESAHNFGCAFDIVLLIDRDGNGSYETASWETNIDFDGDGRADWMEVVNIAKQYGWECGIDWHFKDAPHFQKLLGVSIREMNRRVINKQVIPNTNYPRLDL